MDSLPTENRVQVRDFDPSIHDLNQITLYQGRKPYAYKGLHLKTSNRRYNDDQEGYLAAFASHVIAHRSEQAGYDIPAQQQDLINAVTEYWDNPDICPELAYHLKRNKNGRYRLKRSELRFMQCKIMMLLIAHTDFGTWQVGTPMYKYDNGFIHTSVRDLAEVALEVTDLGDITSSFKEAWRDLSRSGFLTQIRNSVLDESGHFWSRPATKVVTRRLVLQLTMSEAKLCELEAWSTARIRAQRASWKKSHSRQADAQKQRQSGFWRMLMRDKGHARDTLKLIGSELKKLSSSLKSRIPDKPPSWYRSIIDQHHPWRKQPA